MSNFYSRHPRAGAFIGVIGIAVVAGFLSACGGGSSSAAKVASLSDQTLVASGAATENDDGASSEDFRTQLLAYAKCMREEGADFPDPQFDADGRPQRTGDRTQFDAQRNDSNFQKAAEACQDKLPQRGPGGEMTAEQQASMKENLLKFAECMRSEGIDFPDPTFSADGRPEFGVAVPRGDMNRDDPTFEAANTKCRTEVGGGFGNRFGGDPGGNGQPGNTPTTLGSKA